MDGWGVGRVSVCVLEAVREGNKSDLPAARPMHVISIQ